MMPPCGTFDYVLSVPDEIDTGEFQAVAAVRKPIKFTGDGMMDARLVGMAPVVRVSDGGLRPDSEPEKPFVLRSRITLTASSRKLAQVSEASFHVDRALTTNLRAGDKVYIARTEIAGLGLSVLRDGELIVAVGAITAVPLGPDVSARIPHDLVKRARAVFQERDPDFGFAELPIEIAVGEERAIGGFRHRLGKYEVFVVHGHRRGMPGDAECISIRAKGFPDVVAQASAMLIDGPGPLKITSWPDER